MAWSPYKNKVIDFVTRHPGCTKMDVAKAVTRSPRCPPSKQYYIVNTALRNGWIAGTFSSGRWHLYPI